MTETRSTGPGSTPPRSSGASATPPSESRRQLSPREILIGIVLLASLAAITIYIRAPQEAPPLEKEEIPIAGPLDFQPVRTVAAVPEWQAALNAVEQRNWNEAVLTLEELASRGNQRDLARLMLGTVRSEQLRRREAQLAFRIAAKSNHDEIRQEALWRLALSLLEEEDWIPARVELRKLVSEGGLHAEEAKKLVGKL